MRKHNLPIFTPRHILLSIAYLAFAIYVSYTHNPVAEWVFVTIVFTLITITVIAAIKDPRPPYPRRRK